MVKGGKALQNEEKKCIWKLPNLTAPANSLVFQAQQGISGSYWRVLRKIVRNSQNVNVYFPPFYNTAQIPLCLILLLCREADLDNWKVFKKYRVVDSSAWNSCSTLVMVWCKQGIIARSTDWIFCWNRPDWTENVITVKTGVNLGSEEVSQKWMESSLLTFTSLFTESFTHWKTEERI